LSNFFILFEVCYVFMNLFNPPKKVKNVYFRFGEHRFVLLAVFVFAASKQEWSESDIKKVVEEACRKDYSHLVSTLKEHSIA
ncbi:hypothetical protein, partial [Acinetobacter bereziniae]|uniref:hypothetical protein n=2 Tax=Acinetobacter TaxID=469 RepID=UPI001D182F4F